MEKKEANLIRSGPQRRPTASHVPPPPVSRKSKTTYLCWIAASAAVVVSPMSLVGARIVGLVRILAANFRRPLRRRVLVGDAQVLRGGSISLVMLGQWVVDFARVIAVLGQASYKRRGNREKRDGETLRKIGRRLHHRLGP